MNRPGDRSLATWLRLTLDAAWWLVAVSLGLLTVLLAISLSVNLRGGSLTMNLPVAVELNSPVHSDGSTAQTEARIEKLRGNLRFPVQKGAFFTGSVLLVMLGFAFLLWVLTQLCQIFRSLSRGQFFLPGNARRIRWVGFAVIFGEFARAALVWCWSDYTSRHFTVNGLRFVASTDLNGITLVSGLAILVIAEVFREGTRLREDQSLTI